MSKYDKQQLLISLDARIEREEREEAERQKKYEAELREWRHAAVARFKEAVANYDDTVGGFGSRYDLEPPSKPRNYGCSRARQAKARVLLFAGATVSLHHKDPILELIDCHTLNGKGSKP